MHLPTTYLFCQTLEVQYSWINFFEELTKQDFSSLFEDSVELCVYFPIHGHKKDSNFRHFFEVVAALSPC